MQLNVFVPRAREELVTRRLQEAAEIAGESKSEFVLRALEMRVERVLAPAFEPVAMRLMVAEVPAREELYLERERPD